MDGPVWTSVDRIREISEWSESSFIENVRYGHVSPDGQMRFVNLYVASEDETPLSLTPILVHLHVCSVWGTPPEVRRVFVHRCLVEKNGQQRVNRLSLFPYKLSVLSEVYCVLLCHKGAGWGRIGGRPEF